ncbi:MAG TPA: hypothetical protein PKA84_14365, partial [Rubrivivax sp.]|nr:hypothetical protein [Rubrivivax sp.]
MARWTLFALLLAGFVLLPFVLLDARMAALAEGALHAGRSAGYVTLVVVGLLLVDIVLPIPSSFVLATAGYLLGAGFGALACFVGLSCASAAGYALGRLAGEVAARRIVGASMKRANSVGSASPSVMPVIETSSTGHSTRRRRRRRSTRSLS